MMDNSSYQMSLPTLPARFGRGFLKDHAGQIMTDPKIALVELVANSWDAGADSVYITWPAKVEGEVKIEDNGTGMSFDEFERRWTQLSYNRKEEQGDDVEFPAENRKSSRKAFGRSGKGRHGMFCFSDTYTVETWKNDEANIFLVSVSGDLSAPFLVEHKQRRNKKGHGTLLAAELRWNPIPLPDVKDLIGSKFIADPSFLIYVNDEIVQLTDLEHISDVIKLEIPNCGSVLVRHIFSEKAGRTTKQHGVAWWVRRRLVGEPSWKGFDDIPYIDARRRQARHHTFIIEADCLLDQVKEDWSGFQEGQLFENVHRVVKEHVSSTLNKLLKDVHKERKLEALEGSKSEIQSLPAVSRTQVGKFLDEIQRVIPTIGQRELNASAQVISKLEKARTGFTLLEQLAQLEPDDLDKLSDLLSNWSVMEASLVLDELDRRLKLIETLERLVDDPSSDELHEIQPLFEAGLWIFGPEYEGISFTSNRSLLTVIDKFLEDKLIKPLKNFRKRPDFVALPDSTIGLYSRDAYDERGEVNGIGKLLIVELKRGGFEITRKERTQAQDYASELRKSGKIQQGTVIVAFVLGSRIAEDAQEKVQEGKTTIFPHTYSTVIRQAHARTFNLSKKIRELRKVREYLDPEVETVLNAPSQLPLEVNRQN